MKKNTKGFTLIEMLVVVLIVSILSMFALPRFFINMEIAKAREAIDYARMWQAARSIYYSQHGSFPSTDTQLSISTFQSEHFTKADNNLSQATGYTNFTRNNGGLYIIQAMAQTNTIYCCYKSTNDDDGEQGFKICNSLANNAAGSSNAPAGYTCRTITETE